ncbi:transferrin-binding protein-like solute binding protein [Loktanella sp. Alg231-35]|uniref:transferrin-binding protein-like solute binding protein n=1 Tax=Loktanella sp. Alg231-35 TaxID=1922220 RepID=UPI000D54DA97|nr:transferrin-binding protein-like solute binding protein [Loktanella sp. Alg231-35]
MTELSSRSAVAVVAAIGLSACGSAGGGGGGDGGGTPTEPTSAAVEVPPNMNYPDLSNRISGTSEVAYVVLRNDLPLYEDGVQVNQLTGAVSGGLLASTDLDDAEFLNPANGEFSRIVRISGNNVFGAVGLDVLAGDLPTSGVSNYNEGWVGMTATFSDNVYVLTGNATFTVTWDGVGDIDGRFFNLSGTAAQGGSVTNGGTIILTNGGLDANERFSGGSVTGTGIFADLGGTSSTSGTQGAFFGPDADELGGVLRINDNTEDIQVFGAFQAD